MKLVGTGRFELPTPRTPSECSTRLSHVPTRKDSTRLTIALGGPSSPAEGVHSAILHYTGEDGFGAGIAASEHDVVENAIPRVVVGGVRAWAFFRP